MNGKYKIILISVLLPAMSLHPVYAYIGPGGAVSGIGALVALVAAVLFAILGFLWYPIKRLLRRKDHSTRSEADPVEKDSPDTGSEMLPVEKDTSDK